MATTIEARPVRLEVIDVVGGPAHLAATYYPPPHPALGRPLLVCLSGGTYTHRYFDLDVPGQQTYSFARDAARRGFPAVAFDMLGTGESTHPQSDVNMQSQGDASDSAVAKLRAKFGHNGRRRHRSFDGWLCGGLPTGHPPHL